MPHHAQGWNNLFGPPITPIWSCGHVVRILYLSANYVFLKQLPTLPSLSSPPQSIYPPTAVYPFARSLPIPGSVYPFPTQSIHLPSPHIPTSLPITSQFTHTPQSTHSPQSTYSPFYAAGQVAPDSSLPERWRGPWIYLECVWHLISLSN